MEDITTESAKGLEKVVGIMENRMKTNGEEMTLLKRSEQNNTTALEKVIEKATQNQEEIARLQKIEFQRMTWKAEENSKNL